MKYLVNALNTLKVNKQIGTYAFYIGIFLELIVMTTDNFASWTIPYRGRITHIAFCLFLVKIFYTKYTKSEWIIFVCLGILGSLSYFTCEDEYIIRCIVLIMACKSMDMKRICKIILIGTFVSTVIIVSIAFLGISGDLVSIRHYGRGIEEARYCFGFNHANNVHDTLWYMICLYLIVREDKISLIEYMMMILSNIFLYMFTLSRTGFISIILLILSMLVIKYIKKANNGLSWCIYTLMELGIILYLTLLCSIHYNNIQTNKLVARLDPILNSRLEMVFEHAHSSSWKMFPEARTAEYIDNGFSTIVYCYGTIIGIVLIVSICVFLYLMYKNEKVNLIIILSSILLILFMESTYIINVSLLCNMLLIVYMCTINSKAE